jgi:hypothetical protein
VDGVDDFAVVDACKYTDMMPRLTWPSWRWIHVERHGARAFASHFYGVCVAQLMRREAAPHTGMRGRSGGGGGAPGRVICPS